MERGAPDPKRPRREDYGPPMQSPNHFERFDPQRIPVLPLPRERGLQQPERRHSNIDHIDHRPRPPYYDNGPIPRDPITKVDPAHEQRHHMEAMRPHSTGPQPRAFHDMPNVSNGPMSAPYMAPPYRPDPYFQDPNMTDVSEARQFSIGLEYTTTAASSSNAKKRSARTTQACEACRHAKAKCTDPKPCQGCKEKGIECKYDPPPPKQSDKVTSDVANQIDTLRDFITDFLAEEARRQRKQQMKSLQEQRKAWNAMEQSNRAIKKVLLKIAPDASFEVEPEADDHLAMMKAEESDDVTGGSMQPSIEGPDEDEDIDNQLERDARTRDTVLRPRASGTPDMSYFNDIAFDSQAVGSRAYYGHDEEDVDLAGAEDEKGSAVTIPMKHTTGSHHVLQWPSVKKLWATPKGVNPDRVEKFNPINIELARGIIHLHGTGEGFERIPLDEMHYVRDNTSSLSGSEGNDSASSPPVDNSWGLMGNSPEPDSRELTERHNPHDLKPDRTPPLDEKTVRHLAGIYMDTLNIMHPIISRNALSSIIQLFLKQIKPEKKPQPDIHGMVSFVGQGTKRKRESSTRSTTSSDEVRLPYTMATAIMLLILALGKICEHKNTIPHPPVAPGGPPATSPPSIMLSPSPGQTSPILPHSRASQPFPSPTVHSHGSSTENQPKYPADVKNVDVIPGLAYFAKANTILGDHEGEYNLQMVQACLLAGLYQGQLARPLNSYNYIYQAGITLQWVLTPTERKYYASRPRAERTETIPGTEEHAKDKRRKRRENYTLFSFWTCLQLESDILAELDCPKRSGISSLDPIMPWPHVSVAREDGDIDELAENCYLTQLFYRNHLNTLSKDLYGPGMSSAYAPDKLVRVMNLDASTRKVLDEQIAAMDMLEANRSRAPLVRWKDEDPPATNILMARLRGKFYGAQNVTFRHYLRAVLDLEREPEENFPDDVVKHAKRCVRAMIHSCQSFTGCRGPGRRLIVTNCWGTAHAQWGNVIVLHAVYQNKLLRDCITFQELVTISADVRSFLLEVAQPGSAITVDVQFLDAVATQAGTMAEIEKLSKSLSTSFSSNGITPL